MTHEDVAEAFGLPPESLEPIEDDEQLSSVGRCTACVESARKLSELENELVAYRQDVAQYQGQVEALLGLLPPAIRP